MGDETRLSSIQYNVKPIHTTSTLRPPNPRYEIIINYDLTLYCGSVKDWGYLDGLAPIRNWTYHIYLTSLRG